MDEANDLCVRPEFLYADSYKLVVSGYVMPVLVCLTVITNCLVCAVLLRHSMRTPTNVLLVAMAVSDMLTGLSTMPAFIKFFTLGAYVDYMPYEWFVALQFITFSVHEISHVASHNFLREGAKNDFLWGRRKGSSCLRYHAYHTMITIVNGVC